MGGAIRGGVKSAGEGTRISSPEMRKRGNKREQAGGEDELQVAQVAFMHILTCRRFSGSLVWLC
jgi:hypothetical protein